MKRITNILSYLCLLLLLLVAACSDLEEIVVNMQGEEEVELTIQTNIPGLGGSTRTAPTEENITSITALAFDSDHELIKVAIEDVTISPSPTPSTSGTYTVKVPVRTRRIHFIAKNGDAKFTEITNDDYGKSDEALLKDRLTTDLHYWGKLDFDDAEDLTTNVDGDDNVTLYRNMAMLKLDTGSENDDYIAGFIHYNSKGTIAPYITTNSGGEAINDFGYQDDISHYIPKDDNGVSFITTDTSDKNYGKVHYLFEEFNKKSDGFGEESDIVYVICNIGNKFYKVAFKPTSSSEDFYYIIRNKQYTIRIKEGATLGDAYAATEYEDALDLAPINNTKEVDIEILEEMDVYMFVDETGTATLNIPADMTQLEIGYSQDNFAQGGVNVTDIAPNSQSEIEVTSENENGQSEKIKLWIDTYKESLPKEQTTWTLNIQLEEEYINEVIGSGDPSILQIQFLGEGTGMKLNQKLNVHIMLKETLDVTSAVSLPNKEGSEFTVAVYIPDFGGYDENFKLKVDDIESKYNITAPAGLQFVEDANGNYYEVNEVGTQYTFTFALKEPGTVGDEHKINFTATSEYHELTGTTTVTLIDDVPDQDVYEIWVGDGSAAWTTGTENSVEFFGYETTEDNGFIKNTTPPTGFRTTFYDALAVNGTTYSADNHKQQAMVMGSDDSFTFTIPAGDSRWLTMLVATDGNNTASINLQKDGAAYTKETAEDLANGTYNFGAEGEITSAGRLIRYELPAGTYTLQGSDAAYLLYYMRVSTERPTMTDVATDATASNYTLAWSGGEWGNYTKINDTYFVDDDATTFTPTLTTYKGLTGVKLAASSSLNITTGNYSFSDNQGDGTNITYTEVTSNNNGSDNGDIAIKATDIGNESIIYNAGTYALSGIANVTDTDYKYAAFYDVLRLNTVGFTVKNTIKLGLYYSWNGDANTITEYVDGLPYIIGFRMPYSLPVAINADNDTSTPIKFTIDEQWVRRESGLGVIYNAPDYQLDVQQEGNSNNNRVHPRPEWTYKIEWYEVAANTIQPKTTDTDIYFSYGKDNITKEPKIATTKSASEKLALTLDFSSNSENESTHTLNFGDNFYLKATISDGDSRKYAGAHVRFNGSFSNNTQGGGNSAINWTDSREDGSIEYARNSSDGTQLQFKVEAGKTEYEIHWQFVRNDGSTTTPTKFTYTVDNDAYNIENGSESATIVLNDNTNELNLPLNISLDFYRKYSNGATDDNYDNLIYGVSRVGLKATITIPNGQNDADYDGKIVYLQGAFSNISGTGNAGIHWDNSRDSGNDFEIAYKSGADRNGTQLQFQIENGKTEYDIEWVFKGGSQYNSSVIDGDVGFTYAVSATNSNYTVNESNVSLNIQREANIHNQEFKFSTGNTWDTNKTFNEIFPIGTGIFISYSEGQLIHDGQNVGSCTVKFTETNGANQLYIPSFENDPGYGPKQNLYMSFTGAKDFQFTVDSKIAIYEYVANNSDPEKFVRYLSEENPLNGLQLQGTDAVLQRVTVTAPPSAFPNNDPNYVP